MIARWSTYGVNKMPEEIKILDIWSILLNQNIFRIHCWNVSVEIYVLPKLGFTHASSTPTDFLVKDLETDVLSIICKLCI